MTTTVWETGDTERVTVTVTLDGVNVESLDGATISLSILNGDTVLLEKETDDFVADAPTFTCTLATTDLADVATGVYAWNVRVTDTTGHSQSKNGHVQIARAAV